MRSRKRSRIRRRIAMGTEILDVSDRLLAAVMNGIYQGILVTVLVALSFRMFSRTNAATRHAAWLCTLVLLVLLVVAHCFFHSRPPALQRGNNARTAPTPEQEIGTPNVAAMAATPNGLPTEIGSSGPKWPGSLPDEQEQLDDCVTISGHAGSFLQTHPLPLPSPFRGERVPVGRVRGTLHVQNLLRGYVAGQKPDSLSLSPMELPDELQKSSVGSSPPPGATLRGGEPDSPSIAVERLAASTAHDQSAWLYTTMRRLANPVSLTLGLGSRAARILLSICLMLSAARLFMLLL